ncbi:response regulator transcription factor [Magnetococcus sp. PR-3]|uniref:response regulator transcription factor n=1 Tax=Magnetococcus sp. PR-3 TaxID=3120355 RepID=UPI002FCE3968
MNDHKKINIIIVSHEQPTQHVLHNCLAEQGFMVDLVQASTAFHQQLKTENYHIAVLDLTQPSQNGTSLIRDLRQKPMLGIVMLTTSQADQDRIEGYHCGADLVFSKPIHCTEVSAAIYNLAQRCQEKAPSNIPAKSNWRLNLADWHLITASGIVIKLTSKEMGVVDLLSKTPGQPIPRAMLLEKLNYKHDEYGNRNLDALIGRLRTKIFKNAGEEAPIRTVYAIGFAFSHRIDRI